MGHCCPLAWRLTCTSSVLVKIYCFNYVQCKLTHFKEYEFCKWQVLAYNEPILPVFKLTAASTAACTSGEELQQPPSAAQQGQEVAVALGRGGALFCQVSRGRSKYNASLSGHCASVYMGVIVWTRSVCLKSLIWASYLTVTLSQCGLGTQKFNCFQGQMSGKTQSNAPRAPQW